MTTRQRLVLCWSGGRSHAFKPALSLALVLLVAGLTGGCRDQSLGLGTGSVEVSLIMSGELDPDGCTITIGDGPTTRISSGQSTSFTDLSPGEYELTIDDLEVNCEVEGARSRTVAVVSGQSVQEAFKVVCDWRTRIAFESDRDGNWEVYTVNPDGTGAVNLTNNPATDRYPTWSPDGRFIAFTSDRDGNDEIYVISASGMDPVRLTNDPAADWYPAWSPDGSRIAFTSFDSGGRDEIVIINMGGTDHSVLARFRGHDAVWSPDGSRLVYSEYRRRDDGLSHSDLLVVSADGTSPVTVTDNPYWDDGPTWSPAGDRLAYHSGIDEEIFAVNADGTGNVNLTNHPRSDWYPAWSPDGSRIAFISLRPSNPANPLGYYYDVYIMAQDGTSQLNLTNSPEITEWSRLVWSPDGTELAVTIDTPDGGTDILVVRADGTGQINVTSASGHDFEPAWSPDLYSSSGLSISATVKHGR